jgi:hypothetical protein
MGYYYDHIENQWVPLDHDRRLTPAASQLIVRRGKLITDLLAELAAGDGITGLYARLLLRALVKADQDLMQKYGERVAAATIAEDRVRAKLRYR